MTQHFDEDRQSPRLESSPNRGEKANPKGWPQPPRGLQCRVCGCQHLEVSHTERLKNGTIRRRRTCRHCGAKYVTFEGF